MKPLQNGVCLMWVSTTRHLNVVSLKLCIPSLSLTSYCCVSAPNFTAITGLMISFDNFFPSFFLLTKASVCQWHSFSVQFGGFRLWEDLPRCIWFANVEALTMDILQFTIVFFFIR